MERRYTFGNDGFPSFPRSRMDMDDDSLLTGDMNRLRDRFHDRARNYRMQPDPEFDQWFETGSDNLKQPPFKIPKEDERSAYVRNIPIFQESPNNNRQQPTNSNGNSNNGTRTESSHGGSDENLIHQSKSAIPRPVPPQKSTSSTPQQQHSTAVPPTLPKPKNPIRVTPSNGSDSGIERAASGSPSDTSDSVPFFGSTLPRFTGFGSAADRQQRANSVGRGSLWDAMEKERKIPVKVQTVPPPPPAPQQPATRNSNEAIPMGYTKIRDPKEPIPMGFSEQRSASAPGEKEQPPAASRVDLPKAARPSNMTSASDSGAQPRETVHRVPIVVKNSELPRSASAPPKPTEPSPPPSVVSQSLTPLEKIANIMNGVRDLEARITAFSGARTEHEYKLLDELLTQAVIKLDGVQADGVDEVRNARKVAVKRVHDLAAALEAKATVERPKSKSPVESKGTPPPGRIGAPTSTRIVIPMHGDGENGSDGNGEKMQH